MSRFAPLLERVLKHEGGYVNHPDDPGGATNKGVTQAVYNGYRQAAKLPVQSVKHISQRELEHIYRVNYWVRVNGDMLPPGWDYAVFDFGVNSGTDRAIRFAQNRLGVVADGRIGPKTIKAMWDAEATVLGLYFDDRLEFLKGLKNWPTFGKGWENRVKEAKKVALKERA